VSALRRGWTLLARTPEVRLAVHGFVANAAWEVLVTSLYADRSAALGTLVASRLHCTMGDVLILEAAHALTALTFQDRAWARKRRVGPVAVFVALGLIYTTWSEWLNVQVAGSWSYAPEMPTLLGVGLAPLLQWMLVPLLVVATLHCGDSRAPRR
jgi:hypothetical protein